MSHPSFTPEERFAMIVEELRSLPDVTPPSDGPQPQKGFGALALKVQNKIFAMLVEGKLVVKLPKHRVEALIASGAGERFDHRRTRVGREMAPSGERSDGVCGLTTVSRRNGRSGEHTKEVARRGELGQGMI